MSNWDDFEAEPEPAPAPGLPSHWDPTPAERMYFRHERTGDLGYLVRREGKDHIRYDRPNQEIVRAYIPSEWKPEMEHHKWAIAQVVRVAFEADRALLILLGEHQRARKQWQDLSDQDRVTWIEQGPGQPVLRAQLYDAVMSVLRPQAG